MHTGFQQSGARILGSSIAVLLIHINVMPPQLKATSLQQQDI
jgi:hypothetical protein